MKFKSIITLSILFALFFSIVHEFTFTMLDDHQCSVVEYVNEFDAPTGSDDICDIHYEYHQAFMFPSQNILLSIIEKQAKPQIYKESYTQKITQDLIIPPSA